MTARRRHFGFVFLALAIACAVPSGARAAELLVLAAASLTNAFRDVGVGFEKAHQQMYGYIAPEESIQAVTFRVEATGRVRPAELKAHPAASAKVEAAIQSRRDVWLPESGGFVDCPIYDRDLLGPAIR